MTRNKRNVAFIYRKVLTQLSWRQRHACSAPRFSTVPKWCCYSFCKNVKAFNKVLLTCNWIEELAFESCLRREAKYREGRCDCVFHIAPSVVWSSDSITSLKPITSLPISCYYLVFRIKVCDIPTEWMIPAMSWTNFQPAGFAATKAPLITT